MESWRFVLKNLKLQISFMTIALVLMYVTGISVRNDGLPLLVSVISGVFVGGVAFLVVLLVARSKTSVGAVLRRRVKQTSKVLGLLSLPAMVILSVAAGVSEELLFRAVVQGWLAEHVYSSVAIGTAAILFGLLHFGNSATFFFTSLYGVLFGVAYHLTESFVFVAVWHGTYDIVALLFIVKAPEYFQIRQTGRL